MYQFLERLCLALEGCGPQQLAHALWTRQATPDSLFFWATTERGSDLLRTTSLPLWDDYAERGDFAPATKAALLQRARLSPPPP